MRFDDKVSAVNHLKSMKGDNGIVVEYYDEAILKLPTRDSQYKNSLAEQGNYDPALVPPLQFEEVNRVAKNTISGVWELYAKKGSTWVLMR
jgi:hypothetical protein